MSFEIERKFLVLDRSWQPAVVRAIPIRQAYLRADDKASIRVRIQGDGKAAITIKSSSADLRRLELEYDIPTLEAESLIALRQGVVIEKVRHVVLYEGLTWEVDVFEGENAGLCVAEVELVETTQHVPKPTWAGREVTGDARYYNGSLASFPFSRWPREPQSLRQA